jgi:tetratricopeptide (TPR) repeat protein
MQKIAKKAGKTSIKARLTLGLFTLCMTFCTGFLSAQTPMQLQQDLLYFEEQLRSYPNDPDLHYNMGKVYFLLGKTDLAIRYLEKTILLAPTDHEAVLALASTLRKIGHLANARDVLSKSLVQIKGNPDIWYELGVVHSDLASYRPAVEAFANALKFSNDEEQKQIIIYYTGLAQLTDRNFKDFSETLAKLKHDSEYYKALQSLGEMSAGTADR